MIYREERSPAWVAGLAAFVCFCLVSCIAVVLQVSLIYPYYTSLGDYDARTIACIIATIVCSYLVSRKLHDTLRWGTFEDDTPRRVSRGYNLTSNVSGICPECGEATGDRSSSDAD